MAFIIESKIESKKALRKGEVNMYEHHRESIQKLLEYFQNDKDVLAIVLDGSVAKGRARPDSDIDAIIVVTDERYKKQSDENSLCECISGYCTYEGGYFDLKYCDKAYLRAAAQKGSEPTRSAFEGATCVFSTDAQIDEYVQKIGVFQKSEADEKMLSFYGAFDINKGYFWDMSRPELNNPYLRTRTVADMVLFGLRMILQENEVLFPCQKSLFRAVASIENGKYQSVLDKAAAFLSTPNDMTKLDFEKAVMSSLLYSPPKDYREYLSRHVDDTEQWWLKNRPVVTEW